MVQYPFQLVDVFGEVPFSGNPLAVVTLPEDRDTETLQRITRWLNLSETAFLLPTADHAADYRVRIFTLERELPFAGHPTLGSCHAWLRGGGVPKDGKTIVQQCGIGLVPIRREDERLSFAAPPLLREGPVEQALVDEVAAVLGIAPGEIVEARWVDNGPGWVGVMLASGDDVLALNPARSHPRRIDIGVVGLNPPGSAIAYEVRALFRDSFGALIEDPVTGSLNASLAQWLIGAGKVSAPYTAAQGSRLLRSGRIRVDADASGQVWIGGKTATLMSGTAEI